MFLRIKDENAFLDCVLAKQMGESEKMIKHHYGHNVVEEHRQKLVE